MLKKLVMLVALIFVTNTANSQEAIDDVIKTENTTTSDVTSKSDSNTKVESPPPSAIAPSINSANSDLCTVGVSGAVQTQILGISGGKTVRDMNCEKLKNAKTLYDMGMKVAAVSVMCQDERVFQAMMDAGTPCPYDGMIGDQAKAAWLANQNKEPDTGDDKNFIQNLTEEDKSTFMGSGFVGGLLLLLLL